MSEFQWSAARADLTPHTTMEMAGKAGQVRLGRAIHSALEANAGLLVAANGKRWLAVSIDSLYAGPVLTRAALTRANHHGLAADEVWIAASHTHFAPATDPNKPKLGSVDTSYIDEACRKLEHLLDRVMAAAPTAVEAQFSVAQCGANVVRRRHWRWPTMTREGVRAGGVIMAPLNSAHRDTELLQLRLVDRQGRFHGAIWKYACHPVEFPRTDAYSAEYPGVVREALRSHTRISDLPVIFLQGFSGDVRPSIPGVHDQRPLWQRIRTGPTFGVAGPAQWDAWSAHIAQCALGAWAKGSWEPLLGMIEHAQAHVSLDQLLTSAPPGDLCLRRATLGDRLDFIGGNAELCSPWLRWSRPGRKSAHVGYLGDVFGYLPSAQQVREGGYEATGFMQPLGLNAQWARDFEARVEQEASRLLATLVTT